MAGVAFRGFAVAGVGLTQDEFVGAALKRVVVEGDGAQDDVGVFGVVGEEGGTAVEVPVRALFVRVGGEIENSVFGS